MGDANHPSEIPSHGAILKAIEDLKEKIDPLAQITPELKEMTDIFRAGKVGSKGIQWLAAIGTAIATLIGFVVAVRAMAKHLF